MTDSKIATSNNEATKQNSFFGKLKSKTTAWKAVDYGALGFVATNPMVAMAADGDEGWENFANAIEELLTGPAGKGIAMIALLLGGLIGLAKSSAWPALTGLAVAAIFGLGPFMINTIFSTMSSVG